MCFVLVIDCKVLMGMMDLVKGKKGCFLIDGDLCGFKGLSYGEDLYLNYVLFICLFIVILK